MWAADEADARIRLMADTNTRELRSRPRAPDAAPARGQAADGEDDEAQRPRGVPLEPRRSSRRRRTRPKPRCRWRTTRTSTTAPACATAPIRSRRGASSRRDAPPCGLDRRQGGGPDPGVRARLAPERRRAHVHRRRRASQHARRRVLHRADRGLGHGEVTFSYPAVYGGREVAGVKLRFEDGLVVDATAERNEEFLIETLDTDEARRLGELGIGDELRHRPLHQGDPARREDRRHGPPRRRHVLPGDRRAGTTPPSTGTWSATCAAAGA